MFTHSKVKTPRVNCSALGAARKNDFTAIFAPYKSLRSEHFPEKKRENERKKRTGAHEKHLTCKRALIMGGHLLANYIGHASVWRFTAILSQ